MLLVWIGAGVGFVLGTLLLAFLPARGPDGFSWVGFDIGFGMMFGGTFGALVGGVGAPILSWIFLRHVPLGRAIVGTTIATLLGAAVGVLAGYPAIGGCVGFAVGAAVLRLLHRAPAG